MKRLVSVIIPTYKRSDMLTRAIDSVLEQTYDNIEVIVVDDNDPNTEFRMITEQLMNQYSDNNKVIYIKHEKNKNGAAARNTGLKASKGEFVAFLDDDDFFLRKKIEKQVVFLDNHKEFDAAFCARIQNNMMIYKNISGNLSKELLLDIFTPTTSSLLFRREAIVSIGGFDESFKRHQDYELLLKFFRKYKMGSVSDVLVQIGINEGENQLHGSELIKTKVKFLNMFEDSINMIEELTPGFKRKVHSIHCMAIFLDCLKLGRKKDALKMFVRGFSLGGWYFFYRLFNHSIEYLKVHIRRKMK